MCGIFGFALGKNANLTFDETKSVINNLFVLSETRGKESAGIAIEELASHKIAVLKKALPASKFIKTDEYRHFLDQSIKKSFVDANSRNGNSSSVVQSSLGMIAHARLVTNGTQGNDYNNQPVVKDGLVAVHNGIIVNVDRLWELNTNLQRSFEVDTEIFMALLRSHIRSNHSIITAVSQVFNEIVGAASIAIFFNDARKLLLATNTGSLYYLTNEDNTAVIFASEMYILKTLVMKTGLEKKLGKLKIAWLRPKSMILIDLHTLDILQAGFDTQRTDMVGPGGDLFEITEPPRDQQTAVAPALTVDKNIVKLQKSLLEFNREDISALRRCSRCLLPKTFPFIVYNEEGVCNYCANYRPTQLLGKERLDEDIARYRSKDGSPDCLVTFSGGRDSCYGLHYIKTELNLHPIAYTYDWGMVTDLARRNQARLCGKLGIEHIIVSADINKKRLNIQKNVKAWLKKPDLGTIPLFMAGDKQYFYYANLLRKINNIDLVVLCENMLETTNFKSGFCGIRPNFGSAHTYTLSTLQKMNMIAYYSKEYMLNPSYLNSSIVDTISAFLSYYFIPHDYLNLYKYVPWEEGMVEKTLFDEYNWETSPDTTTTWRIGDGTAAFYNYIYYTVAGFSEFDTFRSNQIREGMMTREQALGLINIENRPRYESIQWYCNTIGIDFNETIRIINKIPKMYRAVRIKQ